MADRPDHAAATARATDALGLFAAASGLLEDARTRLVGAAEARRNVDVWRRLDELPLQAIKDVGVGGGVRLGSFEQAGIATVGALMRHDEQWLDDHVPGVGPKTAQEVVAAGRRLYWGVARQARALPEAGVPLDTTGLALVAAAWWFERTDQAVGAAVAYGDQLGPRLRADVAALHDAPGRLGWRFAGDETQQRVVAATADIDTMLGDPAVARFLGELAASVAGVRSLALPSAADLAADYAARSADYAAVLDRSGADAAAPSVERTRGGLSGEVAERVEATVVDLTGLKASLRGYQEFGVKYLVAQQRVILGDEMGLGKTMQAIAALCHVRAAEAGSHFLVVAPASIVPNWERELGVRSDLPVTLLQGTDRRDDVARWRAAGGVALTSYETLRLVGPPVLDGDNPMPRPSVVIVDEAHYVKNAAASRSQVVSAWLAASPRVVLMSGTPLENRVEEFVRLVGLAQPDVASRLAQPEEHAALVGSGAAAFREQVSPVYLRRNQEDVLTELPEKIEVLEWLDLGPDDAAAYRRAVEAGEIMAMRQAATLGKAVHAAVAPPEPSSPAPPTAPPTASPVVPEAPALTSAKFVRLAELFEEYREEGRKVLVFSFFRRVLDGVVATAAPLLPPGTSVAVISGDVAPAQRLALIDRFQAAEGFGVLAAQIDAGGVGLNLQAASVVVLMEPQWKPSTEAQAIARAHRMGQTRRVVVHRMLTRHAVDETLWELVGQKQQLFDVLVRDSAVAGASADAVDPSVALAEEAQAQQSLSAQVLATERARFGLGPVAEDPTGAPTGSVTDAVADRPVADVTGAPPGPAADAVADPPHSVTSF